MSKKTEEKPTLRVGAVSPKIRLGDVDHNVKVCVDAAKRAAENGVRVLAFPELTLTGATCRDMFRHPTLIQAAETGLSDFVKATEEIDMMIFVGLPCELYSDVICNCTAAVYKGDILGVSVKNELMYEQSKYFSAINYSKDLKICGKTVESLFDDTIAVPFDERFTVQIGLYCDHIDDETNIIFDHKAHSYVIGDREFDKVRTCFTSKITGCTLVKVNAGIGESTTDYVYAAHNLIASEGKMLAEAEPFADDNLVFADVCIKQIDGEEILRELDEISLDAHQKEEATAVNKNPICDKRTDMFLSGDEEKRTVECLEAFEIQAQALAARIERSYSKTMVIGVSGGLDSTLALLVCARSADILGMDRKSVIGVTMPCFGTTKRTRSNAEKLSEALGITFRTVDIKASVTQHLKDIGHDGVTPDVTFENAQARERTQVIMDIANMTGGLVVGTGDLSELALGWATYNGDHMSMYAVNASVPKTMVRSIVSVYSLRDREEGGSCWEILDDILATPVSPELLPPKDGEIAQCTEAIVGPYELHDYFLYYMLAEERSPRRIYENAKYDFEGVYDNKTILGWLRVFVRRFFSQQFKRSCMPDGPSVTGISVSPRCGLAMPSDMSAAVWLKELDRIEEEEK